MYIYIHIFLSWSLSYRPTQCTYFTAKSTMLTHVDNQSLAILQCCVLLWYGTSNHSLKPVQLAASLQETYLVNIHFGYLWMISITWFFGWSQLYKCSNFFRSNPGRKKNSGPMDIPTIQLDQAKAPFSSKVCTWSPAKGSLPFHWMMAPVYLDSQPSQRSSGTWAASLKPYLDWVWCASISTFFQRKITSSWASKIPSGNLT